MKRLYRDRWLYAILLAGCVIAWAAQADVRTVNATAPTSRTDGSALPAAQIAGYEFSCKGFTPTGGAAGACPAATVPFLTTTLPTQWTVQVPTTGGLMCFQARAKTTDGLFSDYAAATSPCIAFPAIPANPPGSVTVAVNIQVNVTPVYTLTAAGNMSSALAGFAAVGMPCQAPTAITYRGFKWYRIDAANVKRWATPVTAKFIAPCAAS